MTFRLLMPIVNITHLLIKCLEILLNNNILLILIPRLSDIILYIYIPFLIINIIKKVINELSYLLISLKKPVLYSNVSVNKNHNERQLCTQSSFKKALFVGGHPSMVSL
jgi:hypothetical protein